jgi:ABC-type transport system substrate-binding protein
MSSPAQLILKRNPNYGGHRPRVPREIIYSFGESYANAVKDVTAGRSDYVSSVQLALDANIPASISESLQQGYGPGTALARAGRQQYFANPTVTLDFFALNTGRPLFASTRLRQAANYAINRQALVAVAGPYYGGQPTSHYLPPGMPGSLPNPVYPLGTPDLARARALARGTNARATLLTCNTPACIQTAQLIQNELAPIGITVDITSLPIDAMSTRMATSNSWDIGWTAWTYDFADPSDYISGLFDPGLYGGGPGGGFGGLQPRWIAAIQHAFTLSGQARLETYGRLDDALARQAAPILAWATESARDFFAAHVGCEIYQPIYGIDLGSLCLRR